MSGVLLASATLVAGASETAQAAMQMVAQYEMNEPSGATVMQDSGPHGLHGAIGSAVVTNYQLDGETGYRWPWESPTSPPAKPERLVLVPSSEHHEPGDEDFAIEFRYRSTVSFGNVIQKGQNGSIGGYWKLEQPNGQMTCLFKDRNGKQRAVKSPYSTRDGAWHTIRCELSSWGIRLYTDGQLVASKRTSMDSVSNSVPLSIGGKSFCDQIKITCDYFTGGIADITFLKSGGSPPVNQAPVASFTSSCVALTCTFDGSASSDADGQVVSWQWAFGDGATGSGEVVQHTFASAGHYDVSLQVADDDGATGDAGGGVDVVDVVGDASFVASSSDVRYTSSPSVALPPVQSGDTIVLFTSAASPVSIAEPTMSGWNAVGTESGSKGTARLWWRAASAGDSGTVVTTPLGAAAKSAIAVVVYRGLSPTQPVGVDAAEVITTSSAQRTTPGISVSPNSWVLSIWMHRDSSTTSLAAPGGVITRVDDSMSGGGRPTILIADTGSGISGWSPGQTATAAGSSTFAITWSVELLTG